MKLHSLFLSSKQYFLLRKKKVHSDFLNFAKHTSWISPFCIHNLSVFFNLPTNYPSTVRFYFGHKIPYIGYVLQYIINILGSRDRRTQTCKCHSDIIGNCLSNAFRETSAIMLTACSAQGGTESNLLVWETTLPSSFAHSRNWHSQQECHYQSGNVSIYNSFLLHSFKAERKLCSFLFAFEILIPLYSSPEIIFLFLKDSSWCNHFRQSEVHWSGIVSWSI